MKVSKIVGSALALSALSVGLLPSAFANTPTSSNKITHAKQASVTRAANSMSGTALGGSYTVSGAGMATVVI